MNERSDILNLEILPLSKVKATLSQQVNKTQGDGKRIAITTNGFPRAVLISYEDFMGLLARDSNAEAPTAIDYEKWKKDEPSRLRARDSILGIFNVKRLSRKGQKSYKKDLVDELDRERKNSLKKGS